VRLVISDAHEGLKAAARETLQGASWQRCRVHFARNVLARVPKGHQDVVAAALRTVFVHPNPDEIAAWDRTADMFARQFPKVKELMDTAKSDVLAFAAFPSDHWRKIWSNNPLERVNKEIKRRTNVVQIFPNNARVPVNAGCPARVKSVPLEWRPRSVTGCRPWLDTFWLPAAAGRRKSLRQAQNEGRPSGSYAFADTSTMRSDTKSMPTADWCSAFARTL
jgi:transposase-like protein